VRGKLPESQMKTREDPKHEETKGEKWEEEEQGTRK
jgi:hypothetical protein